MSEIGLYIALYIAQKFLDDFRSFFVYYPTKKEAVFTASKTYYFSNQIGFSTPFSLSHLANSEE